MPGEALQQIPETPRQLDQLGTELRLFAAILLGRTRPAGDHRERALEWASRTEAKRLIASGRATAGTERVLSFKLLYQAAKPAASAVKAVAADPVAAEPAPPRWERALAALITLRHRQRAALALYHVLGLQLEPVAEALALSEPEARRVVESAVAGLLRAVGEPLDVRRALRVAGARMINPRIVRLPDTPQIKASLEQPSRLPRQVTRTLLAPPPSAPPPPVPKPEPVAKTAVDALLERVESIEPDIRRTVRIPSPEPWSPELAQIPGIAPRRAWHEVAIVAAAVLIAVGILLPATHRAAERSTVAMGPRVVAAQVVDQPTAVLGQRVVAPVHPRVRVRAGDSLWSIAGSRLGDPLRWREIWRLNKGRLMADGTRFATPGLIRPSWRLKLPARRGVSG